MRWTELHFKRHPGKTLPQVLWSDPDWFFWNFENGIFNSNPLLFSEAAELDRKARSIRIPSRLGENVEAQYIRHPETGHFAVVEVVPRRQQVHGGSYPALRLNVFDMSIPHQLKAYDKSGDRLHLASLKYLLFGDGRRRMTKRRCETFFEDSSNFMLRF